MNNAGIKPLVFGNSELSERLSAVEAELQKLGKATFLMNDHRTAEIQCLQQSDQAFASVMNRFTAFERASFWQRLRWLVRGC